MADEVLGRAIEAVFNRWSLLNLAIDHEFAGQDTEAKAEWLYDCVIAQLNDSSMLSLGSGSPVDWFRLE
jgi:hypothetical protein